MEWALYALLGRNVSIPDADFSCHPACLAKSTEKGHQGVIDYCPLWLKRLQQNHNMEQPLWGNICAAVEVSQLQGTPSISHVHEISVFHKSHVIENRSVFLCETQSTTQNTSMGLLKSLEPTIIIWVTYLNTISQSHMSPHGCYASWQTTQATVFSILICCVAAQCNWTDATKRTCTTEVYFIVSFGKRKHMKVCCVLGVWTKIE